jgi:lactate 2-monooxygenase
MFHTQVLGRKITKAMSSPEYTEQPNMKGHPDPDPLQYEVEIYQRGLKYERPPFTFDSSKWEELATTRLSAEARGYVWGSAGLRETSDKNREAFRR